MMIGGEEEEYNRMFNEIYEYEGITKNCNQLICNQYNQE